MTDTLVTYIRTNVGNNPFGCIVGKKINNEIVIGFSICNEKDHFNKEKGRKIAEGRISARRSSASRSSYGNTFKIDSHLISFKNRCKKYFKVDDVIIVGKD